MEHFDSIAKQLDDIIETTRNILGIEGHDEEKLEDIKQLMAKRDRQLQALYQTRINKKQLTEEQKEMFRNFSTSFIYWIKKWIDFTKNYLYTTSTRFIRLSSIRKRSKLIVGICLQVSS